MTLDPTIGNAAVASNSPTIFTVTSSLFRNAFSGPDSMRENVGVFCCCFFHCCAVWLPKAGGGGAIVARAIRWFFYYCCYFCVLLIRFIHAVHLLAHSHIKGQRHKHRVRLAHMEMLRHTLKQVRLHLHEEL